MNLLIKYASRGRHAKFLQGMKNIEETISKDAIYAVCISIDADDKQMLSVKAEQFHNAQIFIGVPDGKVAAINRDINELPKEIEWDILINYSDDMRFVVQDWDKILIDKIQSVWGDSLDFFAHFNDGYVGEKLPTMSIMGREYYERFFYIYPPCYKSVSCDAEAMFVAQMLGKWHYFPDVLFKHEHPVNVRAVYDSVYRANDTFTKQDTDTFHRRLNKFFYVNNPVQENIKFQPFVQ